MQKTVGVMLSSYNGERFIEEQIESVLQQEDVRIFLFVRDDGSVDRTIPILNRYQEQYKNINVQLGSNIGVGNSFMELLYSLPDSFDYYCFCDQDDIWDSNKIKRAITEIEDKKCTLYASNQMCVDKDGKPQGLRYDDSVNIHLSTLAILSQNQIAGCTFVFPNSFFRLLQARRPSRELLSLRIHDVWVAISASLVGNIYYDKNAYIKYRQHEHNVAGAKKATRRDVLLMQFNKFFNRRLRKGRSLIAKELINAYPEYIQDELLYYCAAAHKIKNKFRIIRNRRRIIVHTGESSFGFIAKVIAGLF